MRRTVTVTITLPRALLRELDQICKQEDLNRSQVITKMVRAHMAKSVNQQADAPSTTQSA